MTWHEKVAQARENDIPAVAKRLNRDAARAFLQEAVLPLLEELRREITALGYGADPISYDENAQDAIELRITGPALQTASRSMVKRSHSKLARRPLGSGVA